MILWGDIVIETEEGLEAIKEFSDDYVFNKKHKKIQKIFFELLREAFEADKKLQDKVSRTMSEDYVCFTVIPFKDVDNLDSFDFKLINLKEDKIPKRHEKRFRNACWTYFSPLQTYFQRIVNEFSE